MILKGTREIIRLQPPVTYRPRRSWTVRKQTVSVSSAPTSEEQRPETSHYYHGSNPSAKRQTLICFGCGETQRYHRSSHPSRPVFTPQQLQSFVGAVLSQGRLMISSSETS